MIRPDTHENSIVVDLYFGRMLSIVSVYVRKFMKCNWTESDPATTNHADRFYKL